MNIKHIREDGKKHYGTFCMRCGMPKQVQSTYSHNGMTCEPNPELVNKIQAINWSGTIEQYTIEKLKGKSDKKIIQELFKMSFKG